MYEMQEILLFISQCYIFILQLQGSQMRFAAANFVPLAFLLLGPVSSLSLSFPRKKNDKENNDGIFATNCTIIVEKNSQRRHSRAFNSLAFDWVNFEHMASPQWLLKSRLRHLARELTQTNNIGQSPSEYLLRIGGTTGDRIFFDTSQNRGKQPPNKHYSVVINRSQIENLCKFALSTGFQLVIGLNGGPGPRNGVFDGKWDPTNSLELMNS
jgi:hypothetical protein